MCLTVTNSFDKLFSLLFLILFINLTVLLYFLYFLCNGFNAITKRRQYLRDVIMVRSY